MASIIATDALRKPERPRGLCDLRRSGVVRTFLSLNQNLENALFIHSNGQIYLQGPSESDRSQRYALPTTSVCPIIENAVHR